MDDLFSPDGLAAWRSRLDQSPEFQEAAIGWTGSLLLVEDKGGEAARRVFVRIEDGVISVSRAATSDDADAAEFVLAAEPATWQALVAGTRALAAAALSGELRLAKGSVFRLLPHLAAATALLKAAGRQD